MELRVISDDDGRVLEMRLRVDGIFTHPLVTPEQAPAAAQVAGEPADTAAAEPEPIDTLNYFFVSSNGETFTVGRPPVDITPDDALGLAAWLVAMAQPRATHRFEDVLRAVMGT